MRKQSALFCISLFTFSIGAIVESVTPIATTWFWGIIAGICFFIAIVLHFPEIKKWLVFQFLIITKRVPWDEPPDRRFRLLHPHIKELADSKLPYDDGKLGALEIELRILNIPMPVSQKGMSRYMELLARFSKEGRLNDAQLMYNHYNFRGSESCYP